MINVDLSKNPSLKEATDKPKPDHELHRLGKTTVILDGNPIEMEKLLTDAYAANDNPTDDNEKKSIAYSSFNTKAQQYGFNVAAESWKALVYGTHQINFIPATEGVVKNEAIQAGCVTEAQRTVTVSADTGNEDKLHVEVQIKLFQTKTIDDVSYHQKKPIYLGSFTSCFEITPQGTVHYNQTSISLTTPGRKVFPDNRSLLRKIMEYCMKIGCTLLRRNAPLSSFHLFPRSEKILLNELEHKKDSDTAPLRPDHYLTHG